MKAILIALLLLLPSIGAVNFDNVKIVVGPYTQNVTNDSITILWETNVVTENNKVFYKNDSIQLSINGSPNTKHHEVVITPPFNHGFYKVSSDGKESRWLQFKLASYCYEKKNFKCLVFGDSRGSWDGWKNATLVAMRANEEKADIAIHGGDMVGDGRQTAQWNEWLNLMKPLMQNTTLFAVPGNHERNGSRYYEIFALPNNEMWYSFDYGACHFVVLDDYTSWDVGSPQYNWLENDLKSDKPFKIVCFHEPIYCSGGHSPRRDIRNVWEPLFIANNVSLVIQSHNHYYERTNPINGIIYVVTGGAGAPLYPPIKAGYVNVSKEAFHYCIMNVSWSGTPEIEFEAKDVDGNVIDRFVLFSHTEVKILKPDNAIYLFDRKIVPFVTPIIIGGITVEASAPNAEKVEFYIDGNLKNVDDSEPYEWKWNDRTTGNHVITVKAYEGSSIATDKIDVFMINPFSL